MEYLYIAIALVIFLLCIAWNDRCRKCGNLKTKEEIEEDKTSDGKINIFFRKCSNPLCLHREEARRSHEPEY